ncbi:MAG: thiamine phosphate synthase [Bacteroidales bacterium]|jgi:thiamine-phosphate pyrophosphorylase|nr:thiamine phosphate synthase [Bacteroidales bacterium]
MELPEIQYITQNNDVLSHAEQAKLMYQNGISWVQLRMKHSTHEEIVAEGHKIAKYAQEYNGIFIMNDSIDIAIETAAHGVHVGLLDIPIDEARKLVPNGFILGGTANTITDIQTQVARGADYVGLGPFRYTTTKSNLSPIIGAEGYTKLCAELKQLGIDVPIVAVGGISLQDIPTIEKTGIQAVAISSSLLQQQLEKIKQ